MKINVWAVLVSAVAAFVFGSIWYGIFSNVWVNGWNIDYATLEQNLNPLNHAINFLSLVVFAFGFAWLMRYSGKTSLSDAMNYALIIAVLIVPGLIVNALYLGASAGATIVDSVYLLSRGGIVALIIGAWKPKGA